MMAIDPPDEQEDAYPERYSRLLAVLQENSGQWMTRQEIADALGLRVFSGSLAVGIEALEAVGLIEIRAIGTKGVKGKIHYRAIKR